MRHAFLVAETGVDQPATEMGQCMSWFQLYCLVQGCQGVLIFGGFVVRVAQIIKILDVGRVQGRGVFEGLCRCLKLSRAKTGHSKIEIRLFVLWF